MAKKSISIKFSKASLTKEDGKYVVTEISKDDSKEYPFSDILDSLIGTDGLSIGIVSEDELEPISEED